MNVSKRNRALTRHQVVMALSETHRFAEIRFPEGEWPVQLFGTLSDGVTFSFRGRCDEASLKLTRRGEENAFHEFKQEYAWPDASFLTPNECLDLMRRWVGEYFDFIKK